MSLKFTEGEYQFQSEKILTDNTMQSALKEAWIILESAKKANNKELYEKFSKSYEDVFNSIKEAKSKGVLESREERHKIMLELGDIIKLAKENNINDDESNRAKFGDFIKSTDLDAVKDDVSIATGKNINEYSLEDSIGAITFLNRNYQNYKEIGEKDISVEKGKTPAETYAQGDINQGSILYQINGKISQNKNQESTHISVQGYETEKNIDKATTFFYQSIDDLDDKFEVNKFSEKAINKVLGKPENYKLSEEAGFSNEYLHGYNNQEGNKIYKITDFENELKTKDIKDINSKALANYFLYLQSKGNLNEEYLVNNFPPKILMGLGNLWDKGGDDLITKNILEKFKLNDFIETVTVFRSTDSIVNHVKKMFENPNLEEDKKMELSKTFTLFIHKCHNEIVNEIKVTIDGIVNKKIDEINKDSSLTQENKNIKLKEIELGSIKIVEYISSGLAQDKINVRDLIQKVGEFDKKNNLGLPLTDLMLVQVKAKEQETKEVYEITVAKQQYLKKELETKKEVIAKAKISGDTESIDKTQQELKKTENKLENAKQETTIASEKANDAKKEASIVSQATVEQRKNLIEGKTNLEEIAKQNRKVNKWLDETLRSCDYLTKANEKKLPGVKDLVDDEKEDSWNDTKLVNKKNRTDKNSQENNEEVLTPLQSYYKETFTPTPHGYLLKSSFGGNFYVNKRDGEIAKKYPKYEKNIDIFNNTLVQCDIRELWKDRSDIFKVISNLKGGEATRPDSEKMDEGDLKVFLSFILKSIGEEPKNKNIPDLIEQYKKINENKDYFPEKEGDESNIIAKFKKSFMDGGEINTIKLEKTVKENIRNDGKLNDLMSK